MTEPKSGHILEASRDFFHNLVLPILREHFPAEIETAAVGFFGYGSECLGMDDDYSRDHHYGLRVNMLLPGEVYAATGEAMLDTLSLHLPESYRGFPLREGHEKGAGVSPEPLEGFLKRTIGITHAPQTPSEWLGIPEEDIIHVVNGDVWHDPAGQFSEIRWTLLDYYPDEVWKRRIAHWCRYLSGMGIYPMTRAYLRENWVYTTTAFGRCVKWVMELAFLLNRAYFPYDKWLYPFFRRLPTVAPEMESLLLESIGSGCTWERRIENFNRMSDILDAKIVALGIAPPHPRYQGSETSGYRLLEHDYAAILQSLPAEIRTIVPCWDQVYLESFHSGYVASLPMEKWDALLNLTPAPQ